MSQAALQHSTHYLEIMRGTRLEARVIADAVSTPANHVLIGSRGEAQHGCVRLCSVDRLMHDDGTRYLSLWCVIPIDALYFCIIGVVTGCENLRMYESSRERAGTLRYEWYSLKRSAPPMISC